MPGHERLRQPDLLDEVGNAGVGLGETPDDPQPVDVGERLVDEPELAEILRLEDGVGDRAADVGPGRTQGQASCEGSFEGRINGGLYQRALILGIDGAACQGSRGTSGAAPRLIRPACPALPRRRVPSPA